MLIMYTQVLLFDLGSAYWRLDGWKKELWELSHIGIPDNDTSSRDVIVFGFLTYWFIKEVCEGCDGVWVYVCSVCVCVRDVMGVCVCSVCVCVCECVCECVCSK